MAALAPRPEPACSSPRMITIRRFRSDDAPCSHRCRCSSRAVQLVWPAIGGGGRSGGTSAISAAARGFLGRAFSPVVLL